jgi:hypothetical protein
LIDFDQLQRSAISTKVGSTMNLRRLIVSLTLLLESCGVSMAQQPGPEFWRKLSCQPFEPRTKLEALEMRMDAVVLRGFSPITTVEITGVRIDAIDMRVLGSAQRAKGLVVVLPRQANTQESRITDNRAFVDYEEIDPLLRAIDMLAGMDENATKLVNFEAHYHTHGDLEIKVFRQTRSGNAVTLQTGICNLTIESLTLDEFAKLKAMIQEVKTRLDELR